jgi:hypothetical protein
MLDSAVFDRHIPPMNIRSRRTFLAGLGAASVAGFTGSLASAQTANPDVAAVERYFNGLRTLQARFVQSNPGGTVVQGTLSIRRPGRMRFEYDPPSQLKIVADGSQVTMWDIANRDFGQWPIGWTAASFLVKEPMVLQGGDLAVEKVERADGMLQLTLSQAPQAAGRQGDRATRREPDGAARLDDHRQSRPASRRFAERPANRCAARRFALQVRWSRRQHYSSRRSLRRYNLRLTRRGDGRT